MALCLNVVDRRFLDRAEGPVCVPTDVAWITLNAPREADPRDAVETANRDALEAALAGIGATVRRQCEPPGSIGTPCVVDPDCGRGRRCRSRLMLFTPPLTTRDRCTTYAEVVVPLRIKPSGTAAGTRALHVTTVPSAPRAVRDGDLLKLVCRVPPAP